MVRRGDGMTYFDMRFDFRSDLLEVLYNGALDGSTQISMLVGDDARLVSNAVVDVLFRRLNVE
jgi:hypothetical protein